MTTDTFQSLIFWADFNGTLLIVKVKVLCLKQNFINITSQYLFVKWEYFTFGGGCLKGAKRVSKSVFWSCIIKNSDLPYGVNSLLYWQRFSVNDLTGRLRMDDNSE